jgi:hypothetical protein
LQNLRLTQTIFNCYPEINHGFWLLILHFTRLKTKTVDFDPNYFGFGGVELAGVIE